MICSCSKFSIDEAGTNVVVLSRNGANMAAVSFSQSVLVVDTLYSPDAAAEAKKEIEKLFPGKIISTVINTHGHYDHAYGNQVFSDVRIIAHKTAENVMRLNYKDENIKNILKKVSSEKFILTPANLVTDKSHVETIDIVPVYIEWIGNGHSSSDLLIAIPEYKVIFTGDVFMGSGFPKFKTYKGNNMYPGNWSVNRYIEALGTVLNLGEYKYAVPGHGRYFNPDRLKLWLKYFRLLKKDIHSLIKEGKKGNDIVSKLKKKEHYITLFKEYNFTEYPLIHHRTFIRKFYESLKK